MLINSIKELKEVLRGGPYAWPGGYPMYFICNCGETLSFDGVKKRLKAEMYAIADGDRDRITAVEINYEDTDLYCYHTNQRIPSAYAED